MEANELRFGNLINWGDGVVKVDLNLLRDFEVYKRGGLKPIELTEYWIRSNTVHQEYCADVIDIDNYDSLIVLEGEHLIGHDKETGLWEFVREFTESFDNSTYLSAISAPIKYIHTLQNYFPAMSGSELQLIEPIQE